MNRKSILKLTYSALFTAIGICLPFVTGQIPDIGNALLPMHLPVMLCGLICGAEWGLTVGAVTPILRSLLFSKPPMLGAIPMAFELAAYGAVIAIVYRLLQKKFWAVYPSLFAAMMAGRALWGVVKAIIMGFGEKPMTWSYFVTEGFVLSLPGIILQVLLIPAVMFVISKAKIKTVC